MSGLDKAKNVSSEPVIAPTLQAENVYAQTVTATNLVVEGSVTLPPLPYLTQALASTTYAPITPITQTGFKNLIINGDMRIDQRSNGGNRSISGGGAVYTYGVDRWFGYLNGGSGFMTQTLDSGLYYVRLFSSSFSNAILGQRIEAQNSAHLAGQTVTLSFRMASYTTSNVTWAVSYANTTDAFGTQASPTVTAIKSGIVATTGSLTNYSVTFAVPAAATTGLQILFTTPTALGVVLSLTNVQLELGSNATPFERRPIGTELALCQRYYYRLRPDTSATTKAVGFGWCTSTTTAFIQIRYPVPLRTNPSAIETTGTAANYGVFSQTGSGIFCSVVPSHNANTTSEAAAVNAVTASGLIAGSGTALYFVTSSSAFLGWSAEL